MEDVERDGYLVAAADLVSGRAEVGAAVADLDRVEDQILADPEDEAQSEIIYKIQKVLWKRPLKTHCRSVTRWPHYF